MPKSCMTFCSRPSTGVWQGMLPNDDEGSTYHCIDQFEWHMMSKRLLKNLTINIILLQSVEMLSADLNETIAVELYRSFVLDLLSMLEKLALPFQICFSPENSLEKFIGWLGDKYTYIPQQGEDLGQRMENALAQAFAQGFNRAIIMGSDSPDLPEELIHEAFSLLETHDAVIGPSVDGGYYLIGFRNDAFLPEAFEGIQWSTDTVFAETLKILEEAELSVYKLTEWQDIDTLADLKSMFLRNKSKDFRSARTMSYIAENAWLACQLSK